MLCETPLPKAPTSRGLTAWPRQLALPGISDDDLAIKLAQGLCYEAQATLAPKASDGDPDFFRRHRSASPGKR